MSQHRASRPGRRMAPPAGRRRAEVQPRYGRIALVAVAAVVTLVALLGGIGVLPDGSDAGDVARDSNLALADGGATGAEAGTTRGKGTDATGASASVEPASPTPSQAYVPPKPPSDTDIAAHPLPAGSGEGYRVVFSEEQQRVWLVGDDGDVQRTYLVSGSLYDNLDPGTYSVYSRSEDAIGVDDSGTMKYFVRFTQGDNAAIGFHDIPIYDGHRVQSFGQLGTPQSHGCVRQKRKDAIALWDFAPIDTKVVVTA